MFTCCLRLIKSRSIVQEGFARLWRGTNAGLALAIPTVGIYLPCYDIFRNWIEDKTSRNAPFLTPYVPLVAGAVARSLACITCYPIELARTRMQAFKEIPSGVKPPGVFKTLLGVLSPARSTHSFPSLQNYRILWMGVGAQLARDVPFSAICWSTLEPIRRRILGLVGEDANATTVLGANFSAGFVAGSLSAAATVPLDVVKTRRQIEVGSFVPSCLNSFILHILTCNVKRRWRHANIVWKSLAFDIDIVGVLHYAHSIKKDPVRALRMTTRQTLVEVWRDAGMKGLFTGAGPRVARAGPSVGIVVSFYEVMKYILHQRHTT
ncbi:hypothetical protein GIB67_006359 [Kingdonia uniflora]|uniref:Mitochondrial carrier protein n=1 Tax=Kingdonia uniflora TaxID=39325 RepID=A0A7J7P0Z2_9MAGN|nr:hypothetical protein GIB67_006359 [Kingdonia uniflora]